MVLDKLRQVLEGKSINRRDTLFALGEFLGVYALVNATGSAALDFAMAKPLPADETLEGHIKALKGIYPHFTEITYDSKQDLIYRDATSRKWIGDWKGYPADAWMNHYPDVRNRVFVSEKMDTLLDRLVPGSNDLKLVHVMERPDVAMYQIQMHGYGMLRRFRFQNSPQKKLLVVRAYVPLKAD